MKRMSILLMFLAVAEIAETRSDPLADVFPLKAGNKWTYQFSTEYSSSLAHSFSADTGLVEYQVRGAAFSPDTIRWQFIQRRSGQHSSYYLGHWDYRTISDSGTFEMIELNQGRHELYTPVFEGNRCFPFQKSDADSSRFFRYVPVDSLGRAAVHISLVDPSNPPPEFNYHCDFTVSRDSGIVQAQGGQFNFVATTKMRYYLRDIQYIDTTHPTQFALLQNFPNPFNGTSNIIFELLNDAFSNLTVYDLLGRAVVVLVEGPLKAGKHQRIFDARRLASGTYFYRLQVASFAQTRKMNLIR